MNGSLRRTPSASYDLENCASRTALLAITCRLWLDGASKSKNSPVSISPTIIVVDDSSGSKMRRLVFCSPAATTDNAPERYSPNTATRTRLISPSPSPPSPEVHASCVRARLQKWMYIIAVRVHARLRIGMPCSQAHKCIGTRRNAHTRPPCTTVRILTHMHADAHNTCIPTYHRQKHTDIFPFTYNAGCHAYQLFIVYLLGSFRPDARKHR